MPSDNSTTVASLFGYNLKRIRKERFPDRGGLKKCVNDFGTSAATWLKWERGVMPSPENLDRLATFLGIPIYILLTNYDQEEKSALEACPSCRERGSELKAHIRHEVCMEVIISLLKSFITELVSKYPNSVFSSKDGVSITFKKAFEELTQTISKINSVKE